MLARLCDRTVILGGNPRHQPHYGFFSFLDGIDGVLRKLCAALQAAPSQALANEIAIYIAAVGATRSPITDYDLRYRDNGTAKWADHTHNSAAPATEISGLTAETLYEIQTRATNTTTTNATNTSAWSATTFAYTGTDCAALLAR